MQSKGKLFKRKSKAYTLTEKRDKINTFANYQNIIKWKRVPPLTTIFLFFLKTATSSPGSSFFQFDGVRKEDPGTQQIARTKSPRLALGNIGWSQIVSFTKKYMKNNLSPTLLCNIKWNTVPHYNIWNLTVFSSVLNPNHCRSVLNSLLCSLHNWRSVVLVSSAILASFYIPVSFHYGNNALCKIHKVSNLASLDVI